MIRLTNTTLSKYWAIGENIGVPNAFSFRRQSDRATDTLTIDGANDRVGIRLITPGHALDVAGNARFSGPIISKTMANDTTSTGTVDNYALATAGVVRFLAATTIALTGIIPIENGQYLTLYNTTGNNMTLLAEEGTSSATNRFAILGGDLTVADGALVFLFYMGDRWNVIAKSL
jgi:hypothetical protein